MYARVTVVQGSPGKIEQGIVSFNSEVLPAAKGVAGYKVAFLLADRESGKGIGTAQFPDRNGPNHRRVHRRLRDDRITDRLPPSAQRHRMGAVRHGARVCGRELRWQLCAVRPGG